jgi:hypothetical protein
MHRMTTGKQHELLWRFLPFSHVGKNKTVVVKFKNYSNLLLFGAVMWTARCTFEMFFLGSPPRSSVAQQAQAVLFST